jgi:hypothetical protein
MHGRDATGFKARIHDDGTVAVTGPAGTASYPIDGWTSRFVRHLHEGYFDLAVARGARDGSRL